MSRISVSIPDELIARLEPIKDRINVSQVCREALERRIASFERAAQQHAEDIDLEGLVDRLREDRAIVGGKFERLGRRNAAGWLGTGTYLEVRTIAENHNSSNMHGYRLPRAAFRTMKRDMERERLDCEGVHAVAYKTAWLDYVKAVWAEVVNRLEEQADGMEPEEPADSKVVTDGNADEKEK